MKNFKMVILTLMASVMFMPSVFADCSDQNTNDPKTSYTNGSETKYCTGISEALNAAQDGGIVKLLKDAELGDSYVTRNNNNGNTANTFTFDLNGFKLVSTGSNSTFWISDGSIVTIKDSKGTGKIESQKDDAAAIVIQKGKAVLENVKISKTTNGSTGNYAAVYLGFDGTGSNSLEIKAGTDITSEGIGVAVIGNNPKLDILGGKITAKSFAVSGNGSLTVNSTINIEGGELKSTNSAAIYHPQTITLNVKGGILTGLVGIVARQGNVNISGGTINATGDKDGKSCFGDAKEGNECVQLPLGSAVIVDNKASGYTGVSKVAISGGDFHTTTTPIVSINNNAGDFEVTGGDFDKDVPTMFLNANSGYGQSKSGQVGKLHNIKVEPFENGTVDVNENAVAGEIVKIEAEPHDGYQLESIKITKKDGSLVELEDDEFEMPDEDVTITVVFAKKDITITLEIADKIDKEYKVKEGTTVEELLNELKKEHKSLTGFTDKDGKEIDLKTTITNGMYLKGVLTNEEITNPPKTADNILKIAGLGIIGMGILVVAVKKYILN